MFSGEVKSLPEWSQSQVSFLIVGSSLAVTNTLAYYDTLTITSVESFIVMTPIVAILEAAVAKLVVHSTLRITMLKFDKC